MHTGYVSVLKQAITRASSGPSGFRTLITALLVELSDSHSLHILYLINEHLYVCFTPCYHIVLYSCLSVNEQIIRASC